MKNVFLGLGSNIGNRYENLRQALMMIGEHIGQVSSVSPVYQTEPWGFQADTDFLNMVICVETTLTPSGLLGRILMIESQMGRMRYPAGYSSRLIDIDILFLDNEIINHEDIVIPHPRMHLRRFVMIPLNQIAPDFIHPVFNKTIRELLEECKDESRVTRYPEIT
jgi:deoxyguanosine kinase